MTEHRAVSFFQNEYPLVKVFAYGDDLLVYDAKPHFAFILSDKEMDILLDFLLEKSEEELREIHSPEFGRVSTQKLLAKFSGLKKAGVFIKGPVDEISPVDREMIEKQLRYFDENILLRKFCLEVTEDCNYRCTYCKRTLAADYRPHGKNSLSEENAFKGIDYYFEKYIAFYLKLSPGKRADLLQIAPPSLSYYGGEPFLNFDLIKETANYFKNKPWDTYGIEEKVLRFSSNTNLSVMTDEILHFLVDNRVHLFASLDGPEEEHDKCRVFENGKGTFQGAYRNLLKIKTFDAAYFKELVSIFGVYTDGHDHKRCVDFTRNIGVSSCQHFPAEYTGTFVADPNTASKPYAASIEHHLTDFRNKVRAEVMKPEHNMDDFSNLFPFARLTYDHPTGKNSLNILITCPMGFDNLMVTAGGNFLICHKVNDSMPVGHCDSGLNYDRLVDINQRYNAAINNEECRSCWIVQFCSVCTASRMVGDHFVNPTRQECDFFRLRATYNILCFIHLSLEQPDFLEKIFAYRNDQRHFVGIIDKNDF